MAAQQKSHVPKFGNWEGDNVPITAYFDTAMKQKIGGGGGGVIMNPNDPAQNPEAFKFGRSAINIEEDSTDTEELSHHSKQISGPISPVSSEQYQADVEGYKRPFAYRKKPNSESDQTNNSTLTTQNSNVSDSSSVFSVPHEAFDPRQKVTSEKGNCDGIFVTPPRSNKSKAAVIPANDYDMSFTSLSVPKFGAWDEKQLKTGEGFSVIFKKVKEEKQTATVMFPPMQPQTSNSPSFQSNKSKRYCCY